jgi:hypothetical protein
LATDLNAEQEEEPDTIPYTRVFEMEQKKRRMIKAQVT